jgi:hypothetical protein
VARTLTIRSGGPGALGGERHQLRRGRGRAAAVAPAPECTAGVRRVRRKEAVRGAAGPPPLGAGAGAGPGPRARRALLTALVAEAVTAARPCAQLGEWKKGVRAASGRAAAAAADRLL